VVVAPASMVSKYTFNTDTMLFEKAKVAENPLFEVGSIAYLPREA
jgi:hypothetical protein